MTVLAASKAGQVCLGAFGVGLLVASWKSSAFIARELRAFKSGLEVSIGHQETSFLWNAQPKGDSLLWLSKGMGGWVASMVFHVSRLFFNLEMFSFSITPSGPR